MGISKQRCRAIDLERSLVQECSLYSPRSVSLGYVPNDGTGTQKQIRGNEESWSVKEVEIRTQG